MTWRSEVKIVCHGTARVIAMLPKVFEEYRFLQPRIKAILERHMTSHSNNQRLHSNHMNREGRHSDGNGGELLILAFKSDLGARLYGADLRIEGEDAFICSSLDPKKQRDSANQELLRKAARNLGPFRDRENEP
jgi:hypothetical protein